MAKEIKNYRVSCVNTSGEVFKRTTTDQRSAELMWHDVDGASHVLYASYFVDGSLLRQYVARGYKPFERS